MICNILKNLVKLQQSINFQIKKFLFKQLLISQIMSFQIQSVTHRWLNTLNVFTSEQKSTIKKTPNNTYQIDQQIANKFQNGQKISIIAQQLCKKVGFPIPSTLNHLKTTNNTAAMLFNWNILNQCLKKMGFQIDSQTKNMIINGDRQHLNMILRKLQVFYQTGTIDNQKQDKIDDSLDNEKVKQVSKNNKKDNSDSKPQNSFNMKQSLSLSRSQDNTMQMPKSQAKKQFTFGKPQASQVPLNITSPQGDLLQYIVNQLMSNLNLTRKQAIALLSDNNKYLAHVLVKGIKGQFNQIDQLMQKFYTNIDYIVEKMILQNDMCFFFLQILKPSLLSKSEEIAQWGCRILTKIAYQLAQKQMLPLAYDWFVRQAGGLSTTILALTRHPKLNQHVVGYILQFARYNVTQLFTIELKKITNNDNINYVKFMLLIFQPLVESKLSAEELLSSGAIDYWVEMAIKNSESDYKNSKELRLYSIQFLIKIWRAFPLHIEETLDQVNQIMIHIKKGILQSSQIMRFSLLEIMFNLLDEFASKKNPYASILYKKLTFLFVQNHEQQALRQFILRNISQIFAKFTTIPVQIFLQPFIKQVKITQNKSYFLNVFDMEFILVACNHKKLKVNTGIQLYDLLAKVKLNSYCYVQMANQGMEVLLDRFMQQELFFDYTVKLVKISLAMLYSTLKHKKQFDQQERLQAQKRAEIVNFIISLIQRSNKQLNQEIKNLVVHVKVQIYNRLNITHKGIQMILTHFKDIEQAVNEAMQNLKDETQSNAASNKTKSTFHLPKIQSRNQMLKNKDQGDRDQTSSQQSYNTNTSKFSRNSNRSNKQFAVKDYTQFADDEQKRFMQQHNIISKKGVSKQKAQIQINGDFKSKKGISYQKQIIPLMDPKLASQINKLKQRKQQQQIKKFRQKQIIERKKQILKQKIQKELEQRNIKHGLKGGNQKDVQVQVVFAQNQLNQKLFANNQEEQDTTLAKASNPEMEEQRDAQSLRMVIRKNLPFIKKIFVKYATAKVVKKDYFQQKTDMTQIDLIRLCKEKNLERSKQPVLQLLKQANNKETKSINIQNFPTFLQNLCVYLFFKEKVSSHVPMGDFMRKLLKKIAVGQNMKLDDQQDEQSKVWSQKIRYNPRTQLPQGFKKVTQRIYYPNKEVTYPVKKAVKNQSYLACFQVLNQILFQAFKFDILEQQVRFKDELKVIVKKQAILPPKPYQMLNSKRQKQSDDGPSGMLLKDTQSAPINQKRQKSISKISNERKNNQLVSGQKQNLNNRSGSISKAKIVNAAQKKKVQQQQQSRIKREHEQQLRKLRQLQVKRKLQRQKQQKQKQKLFTKEDEKSKRSQQDEKKKQQQQQEKMYKQKQKEKLEKYRRDQQEKQKQSKEKSQKDREKEDQQKKQKLLKLKGKQQQKRLQQREKLKKQRQMSQQKKKKQKQDDQKKKQAVRKQVLKKLQNQKQKYQIQKGLKQLSKQIYVQPIIKSLFTQYKQQLKSLFNYGKQYNQYKLGGNPNQNQCLQSKGWLIICQQFGICDFNMANKLIKLHQKDGNSGFLYQQMEETLFNYQVKHKLEKEMDNYQNAIKESQATIRKFLQKLNIPKDKMLMKDFFLNFKNQKHQKPQIKKRKPSQQIQVTNAQGDKEQWQIQQAEK